MRNKLRFIKPVFVGDTIYTIRTQLEKWPKYEDRHGEGLLRGLQSAGELVLSCEPWAYGPPPKKVLRYTADRCGWRNKTVDLAGKSRKLLRIHRDDNVLIVVTPLRSGDRDVIDGHDFVFTQNIAIGHKVAAREIRAGEKVCKCGVPIGSAKEMIPAGAHVHLHNLKSDYIATYTLDKDHVFVK